MALRYALLGVLAERPHTGWRLVKHFESTIAYGWTARHSQIYLEQARLREAGLIEQTGLGPRGAKEYALTSAGDAALREWLRETEPSRTSRSDAALRVFLLWLLDPTDATAHLEREAAYLRGLVAELERIEAGPREHTRLELAYALALDRGLRAIRARIEWLDAALERVASAEWRDAPLTARR